MLPKKKASQSGAPKKQVSRHGSKVGKGTEAPCLEKRRTKRCFCGSGEFLLAEHVNVVERQEPSLWDIRTQLCNLGGHFEQAGEAPCHSECT